MRRIPFDELRLTLSAAMRALGLPPAKADLSARLTAETTRDGVYTHGLNRFPRFVAMVRNGHVVPDADATLVQASNGLERWTGNRGVGNVNAFRMMERAMELARGHGIGCVGLADTNHWMRGGTYGWQGADGGCLAVCWTNTGRNLPAWGTTAASLGNNPLVLAVPRPGADGAYRGGPHVVLDMAMSQFSYGQMDAFAARGEALPVPGGYSEDGELTTDAAAVLRSMRALPIGYWKGSGLALLLDLFAASLSGGRATHEISSDPLEESGLSQVFIALDPGQVLPAASLSDVADSLLAALQGAPTAAGAAPPRYPGERTIRLREENLRLGVPVEDGVWAETVDFAKGSSA